MCYIGYFMYNKHVQTLHRYAQPPVQEFIQSNYLLASQGTASGPDAWCCHWLSHSSCGCPPPLWSQRVRHCCLVVCVCVALGILVHVNARLVVGGGIVNTSMCNLVWHNVLTIFVSPSSNSKKTYVCLTSHPEKFLPMYSLAQLRTLNSAQI